ncbi:MAG: transposase [Pirellulaceae bacterium]
MTDPIAFFLTWATYGTWLPGDQRGWTEYQSGWKMPQPFLELECKARLNEEACILTSHDRRLVETQIVETCRYRNWTLKAVNCRSNHIHTVVAAPSTSPRKIRIDLKAYTTRKLRTESDQKQRNSWWAERGSIRWVWNEESLEQVVAYTCDAQDRKDAKAS